MPGQSTLTHVRIQTFRPNGVLFRTETLTLPSPWIIMTHVRELIDFIAATQDWQPRFKIVEVDASKNGPWIETDATAKYLGKR